MLPILPGTHWSEAKPLILPGAIEAPALPAPKRVRAKKEVVVAPTPTVAKRSLPTMGAGRLSFFEPPAPVVVASAPVEKPKREKRAKQKHDPKLVAAARELRDRYLEQCDARPAIAPTAKYEVGRVIAAASQAVALLSAA